VFSLATVCSVPLIVELPRAISIAVSFSAPSSFGTALNIGNIPAGQHKAIWIKRIVNAGAAAYNSDTATITVQCDTSA
jgi:hypothetical protein